MKRKQLSKNDLNCQLLSQFPKDFTYEKLAEIYDAMGYCSKSNRSLTKDHICNFMKGDLNSPRVKNPKYSKPAYKGKHWQSFTKVKNIQTS